MGPPPLLHGFNPTLLLVLNLAGTFVFGLSGGMAGVRGRLDIFGVVVLAVVVGIAGGTIRDLLIGIPPQTFRDWRYLAVAAGAGGLASVAHPAIARRQPAIDTLDAAGLGLFCVTGAALGLAHRLGVLDCTILGTVTGIGGGIIRDLLLGQVPAVLQGGLYATPALIGAAIVTVGARMGEHGVLLPVLAAAVCFALRLVAMRYDLRMPVAADLSLSGRGGGRRRRSRARPPQ
ncbi:MAG TPA: TRIC cation channel family protein [Solirubrobacteraceae bacterium]|nr:TRIC cation channel family protein [Solirubrobacteraceae bacterium]